jgi:hypothetical protein
MAKFGKRTTAARAAFAGKSAMAVEAALTLIKSSASAKFDETLEIAMNLGVDPRHADQMVRGVVQLPNGTGKTVRVAVFARGAKADEAKAAGADIVGVNQSAPAGTMAPLLTSFSPDALEAAQSAQPQLPRGLLLEQLWTGWLETALRLGCVAVVCNQALWDDSSVRQARSAGLRMSSYTVNDEWAAERLLALGTDAIITDRVDLFSASR